MSWPETGGSVNRMETKLRRMSAVLIAVAAGALIPVAAGVFDNTHASPPAGAAVRSDGTITGLAAPCVGLALPGTTSVTINARRHGHIVMIQTVLLTRSPGNPYRLRLPAGQYVISAPRSGLPDRTVNVRPDETVRLNFLPACK